MALIDCPECEKRISDKAASCPHCGYPLAEERAGRRREAFLLDPLAELADLAEHSIRTLREALDPALRRKKEEEPEKTKEAPSPGDEEKKGQE